MKKKSILITLFLALCLSASYAQEIKTYTEKYRPQIHFSPKAHWINDPNGMVYYNNTYHLFFQYYPDGSTWGPMHWGHATSKDMIHWDEKPIALYPDSLGFIFSGSAVADVNNTSGFGKDGKIPLVAIFTHHDTIGEKAGKDNFQNQSIAYSLDEGSTWVKYSGNPVLKNPGIRDFRDPKVRWNPEAKKWIMTLATKDRITFYSSNNLKDWNKESDFGATVGAHGGVWECPDLFPLTLHGKTYWVLLVSINPGGPNKGSATQYFVGDFDGKTFTPVNTDTRWIDYGPDDYAGVTWSNTDNRTIFLGWMSNWLYANQLPTESWRNAMTLPRELALKQVDGQILLASTPVKELNSIKSNAKTFKTLKVNEQLDLTSKVGNLPGQYMLKMSFSQLIDHSITLANDAGEQLVIGYDKVANQYYIDRTKSGKVDFHDDFSGKMTAPRLATGQKSDLTLIVDATAVELFADEGLTVMTSVFFPGEPYKKISIQAPKGTAIHNFSFSPLNSIWNK